MLEGARGPRIGCAAPGGRGEGLSPPVVPARPGPAGPSPRGRGSPLPTPGFSSSPLPPPTGPVCAPGAVPQLRGGVWGGDGGSLDLTGHPGDGLQLGRQGRSRDLVEGDDFCGGHSSGSPFAGWAIASCTCGSSAERARGTQNTAREQQPAGMETDVSSWEKWRSSPPLGYAYPKQRG